MRCLLALCLLSSASGDGAPPPAHDQGWQAFSLGVMPVHYARPGELRYLVSVPGRYIDGDALPDPLLTDDQGRVVANAIRFAVKYPSLEPAKEAWDTESVRLTIGNITEDGISKSVDGSWLNGYSQYHVPLADEHGLKVRRADFDPLDARLYFLLADDQHVRIKCETNLGTRDRWCVMDAKRPGEPYLQTGFYVNELPHWRERLDRLRTLFRSEGKQELGTVHRSEELP